MVLFQFTNLKIELLNINAKLNVIESPEIETKLEIFDLVFSTYFNQ